MIAKLPCDLKITRILLMGYCFHILEQAASICAFLNMEIDMFYIRHSFLRVLRDKLARHKLSLDDLILREFEEFSLFVMRICQNKSDSATTHIRTKLPTWIASTNGCTSNSSFWLAKWASKNWLNSTRGSWTSTTTKRGRMSSGPWRNLWTSTAFSLHSNKTLI